MEVEVLNVSNPQDPLLLGEGTKILRHLFPRFDATTTLSINLTLNSNLIRGEVRLQGIITEHETLLDELKLKFYELDGFKKAYEGKLSGASESDMKRALMQVEKANKKNVVLQQKLNEIQEKNLHLSNDNERLQQQLEAESKNKVQKSAEDTIKMLKNRNDELLARINDLTRDLQLLTTQYDKSRSEKLKVETEMQELRFSFDQRLEIQLKQIKDENLSVRTELEDTQKLLINGGDNNRALLEEINLLKASRAITFKGKLEEAGVASQPSYLSSSFKNERILSKLLGRMFKSFDVIVAARTRPPTEQECLTSNLIIENYNWPLGTVNVFSPKMNGWRSEELDFHWPYDTEQITVFQDLQFLLNDVIPDPYEVQSFSLNKSLIRHAGIVSRGGTSSGKTFTLFGSEANPGLATFAFEEIFKVLEERKLLLRSELNSPYRHFHDLPSDAIYEYSVEFSLLEVIDDKVYSRLSERKNTPRVDLSRKIVFDPASNSVHIEGLTYEKIASAPDAIHILRDSLNQLQSGNQPSSIILEIIFSIRFNPTSHAVKSKFILADIVSVDKKVKDSEKLTSAYEALINRQPILFDDSKLLKILQPLFISSNKQLVVFHLYPTDSNLDVTNSELQLASRLKSSSLSAIHGKSNKDSKDYEKQLTFIGNELREAKRKNETAEKSMQETKQLAEELVKQLNDGNKLLLQRYLEEKDLAKQLKHDLALTQRNLKKAIGETQEQRKINERLAKLVKGLEDERNSLNALIQEN